MPPTQLAGELDLTTSLATAQWDSIWRSAMLSSKCARYRIIHFKDIMLGIYRHGEYKPLVCVGIIAGWLVHSSILEMPCCKFLLFWNGIHDVTGSCLQILYINAVNQLWTLATPQRLFLSGRKKGKQIFPKTFDGRLYGLDKYRESRQPSQRVWEWTYWDCERSPELRCLFGFNYLWFTNDPLNRSMSPLQFPSLTK